MEVKQKQHVMLPGRLIIIHENNTNADLQKPIFNAGGAPVDPYYAALGYLKASFIKVRNISLGYNFTAKDWRKKVFPI